MDQAGRRLETPAFTYNAMDIFKLWMGMNKHKIPIINLICALEEILCEYALYVIILTQCSTNNL